MAAKKPQVKKQEPVQQAEQKTPEIQTPEPEPTNGQDQQVSTTIKLKVETKGRLEILKGMLDQPDYDGVVSRLIDTIPQKLSTEEEIHLVMPVSRFRWLMAHQDSCDCRQALNDAKV